MCEIDVVEKDLENLGAPDWMEIVQNRVNKSDLVMAVKTHEELLRPEEEKVHLDRLINHINIL